ncbi:MAG: hypothetical protein PUK83_02070 [Clostridia bacterium]|nr:hypothetical protein [Clostridia bacterium]MDY5264554.1 hypothetical protein [Eubacteriales bacterium]
MVEYNEIRDYIFEKYGKRVSNKWIAEIKREQGMLQFYVEGEEYCKTCPKKAEEYIIEAFEYFQILDERPDISRFNEESKNPYITVGDK